MFPALKKAFLPLALIALFVGSASLLQTQPARAALEGGGANGVYFLEDFGGDDTCDSGEPRDIRLFGDADVNQIHQDDGLPSGEDNELQDPIVQIAADDELILCVEPLDPDANVVFRTSGAGIWNDAHCGDLDTLCLDEEGVGSNTLTVIADPSATNLIAITFSCEAAGIQDISIIQDDSEDEFFFSIMCKGDVTNIALTVTPTTVEATPAIGNTSHALLQVVLTDSSGGPLLPGTEVTFEVDRCSVGGGIETLEDREDALELFEEPPVSQYVALHTFADRVTPSGLTFTTDTLEVDTNEPEDGVPNHSEALAIFHAEGCDPGPVKVTVLVDGDDEVTAEATITVVGPVAHITIAAAPTQLICGEKAEITVTATDALNHNVSEHTFLEVITNYGGVLAGTGSSLTSTQPVNPLSSTTVEIVNQKATAYLLTSDAHVGPYEVLAASSITQGFLATIDDVAPVVAQVTVTCTKGATSVVTAPNTGTGASTGTIRPPNTGDAGLIAPSDDHSVTLFIVAGAVALVLASFARLRLARSRG